MYNIPAKIFARITNGIKQYQPILASAKSRDVNESDTVIIVTDILSDLFGYNKYSEITSEFMIRGSYCDLATKIDGKVNLLLEVKAIGIDLKEMHTRQVIEYASTQGTDWVVLTNGINWQVYKVLFSKPIEQELVFEFDFLSLNFKRKDDAALLYPLTKEGCIKSYLDKFHTQKQALSRFFLGSMLLSDIVLDILKRELKRVSPDVKIETEQIKDVLENEVIKREVLESEKFLEAKKKIAKSSNRSLRSKKDSLENETNKEQLALKNTIIESN